jgi:hypothetical protein
MIPSKAESFVSCFSRLSLTNHVFVGGQVRDCGEVELAFFGNATLQDGVGGGGWVAVKRSPQPADAADPNLQNPLFDQTLCGDVIVTRRPIWPCNHIDN